MEIAIGQIVRAKRGRDQGKWFVVLALEGDYVWMADGAARRLTKPKKKKIKHLQPTNLVAENVRTKLSAGGLMDSDIRTALASTPFSS